VELTKCLLEFHSAAPTREAVQTAISTGSFELVKLMLERLREAEFRDRVDLLEVAAEFHQPEVLTWLFRGASVFERELFGVFALERKLADSLVVAFESGLRPWWSRARVVSLKWRASSRVDFIPVPDGFSSEGGWWTVVSGVTSALPALGCEDTGRVLPRDGVTTGTAVTRANVAGEWTLVMSRVHLGKRAGVNFTVKSVVFPVGVTAIGGKALYQFRVLESVVLPASCKVFENYAFVWCASLKAVSLPVGCEATGDHAFFRCT
jgi:hypothetical protein